MFWQSGRKRNETATTRRQNSVPDNPPGTALAGIAAGTDADARGFRCERSIQPGAAGPNRLQIDLPLLAAASPFRKLERIEAGGSRDSITIARDGLSDLRIFDAAGREIPYLLMEPVIRDPQWIKTRLTPTEATARTSGFEVDPGRPVLGDRLRLTGCLRHS